MAAGRRDGCLAASILITERKRVRARSSRTAATVLTAAPSQQLEFSFPSQPLLAPGPDWIPIDRRNSRRPTTISGDAKGISGTEATDKIQFDAGAAAYKMKEYNKALQSFSQALLSPDPALQSRSHYNLGNTLYQHGDAQKDETKKLKDWTNALQHYEETLKIEPENKEAKENYDYVKNKIEELKKASSSQLRRRPLSPNPQDKKDQRSRRTSKGQEETARSIRAVSTTRSNRRTTRKRSSKKIRARERTISKPSRQSPRRQDKTKTSNQAGRNTISFTGRSPGKQARVPAVSRRDKASPSPGENGAKPDHPHTPATGNRNAGLAPTPSDPGKAKEANRRPGKRRADPRQPQASPPEKNRPAK